MGQSPSRRTPWEHSHTRIRSEENGIDPDDGISWLCSACTLPIFSTPFIIKNAHLLHDQCANLPKKLMHHAFHHAEPLALKDNWDSSSTQYCDKCHGKCGSMFYQCLDSSCDLQLDLLCSLQIKILHRSHEHRLMAIRGSAAFICGACGTQHQGRLSAPSYLCSACGFWIHRDCASSPNAIKLVQPKHQHSLFLTYNIATGSSTQGCKCAICGEILLSLGAYICVKCGYYAHIRCATSDPRSFEPVLIRDAKLADLLHLPMADERSSIVQYMLDNTSAGDDEAADDAGDEDGIPVIFHHANDDDNAQKEEEEDDDDDEEEEEEEDDDDEEEEEDEWEKAEEAGDPKYGHDRRLHKHPLIFHDQDENVDEGGGDDDDDDDDGTGHSSSRVCNAC